MTEMKIVLMILDQEECAKGRGFMKRVKDRWDVKYPKYQQELFSYYGESREAQRRNV